MKHRLCCSFPSSADDGHGSTRHRNTSRVDHLLAPTGNRTWHWDKMVSTASQILPLARSKHILFSAGYHRQAQTPTPFRKDVRTWHNKKCRRALALTWVSIRSVTIWMFRIKKCTEKKLLLLSKSTSECLDESPHPDVERSGCIYFPSRVHTRSLKRSDP